jgi:hypothetical protein
MALSIKSPQVAVKTNHQTYDDSDPPMHVHDVFKGQASTNNGEND